MSMIRPSTMQSKAEQASCCAASDHGKTHCPVDATITLIGGKYKSLILWNLTHKTLRFSELRREVPTATPKMLTQQLRELEADGLVAREVFPVVPPKVEYSLTELGKSIRPVLEAMYGWGTDYLRGLGLEANCSMAPFSTLNGPGSTEAAATGDSGNGAG